MKAILSKQKEETLDSHPSFELQDSIVESDLSISHTLPKIARDVRRDYFKRNYNHKDMIQALVSNPDDATTMNKLTEFASLDGKVIDAIVNEFDKVLLKDKNHNFLKAVQAVLAGAATRKSQEAFLKTLRNKDLIRHSFSKILHLKKPHRGILTVYSKLASRADPETKDDVALNAYLSLSSLSLNMKKKDRKEFIGTLISKLQNSKNRKQFAFYMRSLGNAGDAAPLHVAKKLLLKRGVPLFAKSMAADSLRHRSNNKEAVNQLIRKVIVDKRLSGKVKSAVIGAHNKDSTQLQDVAAVNRVMIERLLRRDNSNMSKELLNYIKTQYSLNDEELTRAWAQAVSESDEEMSEEHFFQELSTIITEEEDNEESSDETNKAEDAFGAAQTEFKNAIFINGTQVCIPVALNETNKMCLYDKDMLNYLNSFNPAENAIAKHISYETLVGGKKANLYIGALAYTGTNFNCDGKDFTFTTFGRFSAKANMFANTFSIVTVNAKAVVDKGYNDNVFVEVLGKALVNRKMLEIDDETLCHENSEILYEKTFTNLPSISTTIPLGPVPLTFSVKMSASTQIKSYAGYCVNDLSAATGLLPSVKFGLAASAAVGIPIAKAGIEVNGNLNYGLHEEVGLKGTQCSACATIETKTEPMNLDVIGFAEIDLKFWSKNKRHTLYNWSTEAQTKTIHKSCVNLQDLKAKLTEKLLSK